MQVVGNGSLAPVHWCQGKERIVDEVILHCAAIETGQFDGWSPFAVFNKVNEWHTQGARGRPPFKNGFGYHGLVMPDGQFYPGRPFDMMGAHVKGHNCGTLGLLMIESRKVEVASQDDLGDDPLRWFAAVQIAAVKAKIASWPFIKKVSGHNDYAPKACPGFKVVSRDFLPLLRQGVRD